MLLFVGCLTSQQHASVSQGWIRSDNFTYCHTEIEAANQTFYLTQSQCTDTGPASPSADPITPGAWQGSHWSAIFLSHWNDSTRKNPVANENRTQDLPLSRQTPGQRGGQNWCKDYRLRSFLRVISYMAQTGGRKGPHSADIGRPDVSATFKQLTPVFCAPITVDHEDDVRGATGPGKQLILLPM